MREWLVSRLRGTRLYALGFVLLLAVAGLSIFAWSDLLSAMDPAGEEPTAAVDSEAPKQPAEQAAVVEGAFRQEASSAGKEAEEPSAEKEAAEIEAAERRVREKASAEKATARKEAAETVAEEEAAAERAIAIERSGLADTPADEQASASASASATASAAASASVPPAETSAEEPASVSASVSAPEEAASASASASAGAEESAAASSDPAAAPADTTMSLDVPAIGLSTTVYEGTGEDSLSAGTGHLSGTGYPWVPGSNTYVAGHRLGYPGTASDHVFWDLPSLAIGDEVYLTDANGKTYAYAVSEILEVPITDLSVTAPVGRDVVSLQTCIEDYGDYWSEGPNWNVRYVVRADRIG